MGLSVLLVASGSLHSQELTRSSVSGHPDPNTPEPTPTSGASTPARVVVTGQEVPEYKLPDEQRPKLSHIMKEVEGTQITVTKKTTVTKLDQVPTIIDNDQQEAFARTPGILVTQQQTPAQFNFSYRGLGNPQESEYVLVLQDGVPITTDWIGFPTLYYLPLYQSVSEIQVLRAGNSLLYGPEPAPAINFVSRRPTAGRTADRLHGAGRRRLRPLLHLQRARRHARAVGVPRGLRRCARRQPTQQCQAPTSCKPTSTSATGPTTSNSPR